MGILCDCLSSSRKEHETQLLIDSSSAASISVSHFSSVAFSPPLTRPRNVRVHHVISGHYAAVSNRLWAARSGGRSKCSHRRWRYGHPCLGSAANCTPITSDARRVDRRGGRAVTLKSGAYHYFINPVTHLQILIAGSERWTRLLNTV
jgi:hypothetical protein